MLKDCEIVVVNTSARNFPTSDIKGYSSEFANVLIAELEILTQRNPYFALPLKGHPLWFLSQSETLSRALTSKSTKLFFETFFAGPWTFWGDCLYGYLFSFPRNYIRGEKDAANEKRAMFLLESGNQGDQTSAGLLQTIDEVEGWHLRVTSSFQWHHTPKPSFRERTKLDACNQNFSFLETSTGTIIKSWREYQKLDEKFFRLVNESELENSTIFSIIFVHTNDA